MTTRIAIVLGAMLLLLALAGVGGRSSTAGASTQALPPVKHVFLVLLENQNASTTFGPHSPATYLSRTLPSKGAFLPRYYGVTHASLGNYVALISGQGSNLRTQSDCKVFSDFVGGQVGRDGQALGQGCVYPASIQTVADQLQARGLTWKGYMEDMGNDPAREAATCGHPAIDSVDRTQRAEAADQYAARHNPFVYFHSIIDRPTCAANDVPLSRLPKNLAKVRTTANLSFIAPNLCHDGHDAGCADGEPGGLVSADAWLRRWVPRITRSKAFRHDGLLLILFDEAAPTGSRADASACCNEAQFPNTPNNGGETVGRGGGRVGAVALSPFIRGGTVSTHTYNHFSTLRTIEQLFGLRYLGYAGSPDPGSFRHDVFTAVG